MNIVDYFTYGKEGILDLGIRKCEIRGLYYPGVKTELSDDCWNRILLGCIVFKDHILC